MFALFLFYCRIFVTFGCIKSLINWIWVPSNPPPETNNCGQSLWLCKINVHPFNAKGIAWNERQQCWKWFSLPWPHRAMTSCGAGWSHLKESQSSRFTILACSKTGLICKMPQIGCDADCIKTITNTASVRISTHEWWCYNKWPRSTGSQLLKLWHH